MPLAIISGSIKPSTNIVPAIIANAPEIASMDLPKLFIISAIPAALLIASRNDAPVRATIIMVIAPIARIAFSYELSSILPMIFIANAMITNDAPILSITLLIVLIFFDAPLMSLQRSANLTTPTVNIPMIIAISIIVLIESCIREESIDAISDNALAISLIEIPIARTITPHAAIDAAESGLIIDAAPTRIVNIPMQTTMPAIATPKLTGSVFAMP